MNDVVLVLTGWLLGLLTPQIVEGIARHYRRREIMKSMALELDELRFKLVTVRCSLRLDQGTLDRSFVEWGLAHAKDYKGVLAEAPARKHLIEYGSYADEQLATLNALSERGSEGITVPQKIVVPYLESQLDCLSILPPEIQRQLIEVLTRVTFYNTSVDELGNSLTRTFDPALSESNRQILQRNMSGSLRAVDTIALQIVAQADTLIPKMG